MITPTKTYVTSPWAADPFSSGGSQRPALETINSAENVKPAKTGFLPREARMNLESGQVANNPAGHSGYQSRQAIDKPFASDRSVSGQGSLYKSSSRRSSGENLRSPPPTKDAFSDTIPPLPTIETKKQRSNYLPREAKIERRSPNADLIDFLRAGPPPGTVAAKAASNTNMHSQASASPTLTSNSIRSNGMANTRSSASPSNRTSSVMTQSVHGSVNSHTGLLPQNSRGYMRNDDQTATPAYPPQNSTLASSTPSRNTPATNGASGKTQYRNKDPYALSDNEEEDGLSALPTAKDNPPANARHQHRSKDPYAMPSDDEFDDDLRDLDPVPKPKTKKEESFVDFLRNVEPPPHLTNPAPSSRLAAMAGSNSAYVEQGYQSQGPNKLKKEKSGSMRTRFFGKKVPT